jgi:hypothetical protein
MTEKTAKALVGEIFGEELARMNWSDQAQKEAWIVAMRAVSKAEFGYTTGALPADASDFFPTAGTLFHAALRGDMSRVKLAGTRLTAMGKRGLAVRAYRAAQRLLNKQEKEAA